MSSKSDIGGARGIAKTAVSSGERGDSAVELFAAVEHAYPGIEEEIGLSSAALRAGNMVRKMRHDKGWTQTQLAAKLGWDQVRISNIERGEGTRGPTFDVLSKIAEVCDCAFEFQPRTPTQSPVRETSWGPAFNTWLEQVVHGLIPERSPSYAFDTAFGDSCVRFVENVSVGRSSGRNKAPDALTLFNVGDAPYVIVTGQSGRMVLAPLAIQDDTAVPDVVVRPLAGKF